MNEKRQRRKFTEEFKNNAVQLVLDNGYSCTEVARRLNVNQTNVSRWVRMKKQLVIDALTMAFWQRKPEGGLLHHSDRGSQYASHEYQKQLKSFGMKVRMSRKGNCWDNSPTERFFRSLKSERLTACRFHYYHMARPFKDIPLKDFCVGTVRISRSDFYLPYDAAFQAFDSGVIKHNEGRLSADRQTAEPPTI